MAHMAFSDKEIRTYRAAQAIADLIHNQARPGWPSGGFWLADQRMHGVRYGVLRQTAQGLYIVVSDRRMPTAVITPWGKYYIISGYGGTATTIQAAIAAIWAGMEFERDEAAREAANLKEHWLFAIHGVGAMKLPKPQLRSHEQLTPRDKAIRQWAALGRIVESRPRRPSQH